MCVSVYPGYHDSHFWMVH